MLIEELAGGVVVLDRQPRAGDAVIRSRLLDQRQRRLDAGAAKIADADFDGIGRKRAGAQRAQADDETDQQLGSCLSWMFPCTGRRSSWFQFDTSLELPYTIRDAEFTDHDHANVLVSSSRLFPVGLVGPRRPSHSRLAVFDFELLDTSLQGEMKGPQADEQRRLQGYQRTAAQRVGGRGQIRRAGHRAGQCCGARQQLAGLRRM